MTTVLSYKISYRRSMILRVTFHQHFCNSVKDEVTEAQPGSLVGPFFCITSGYMVRFFSVVLWPSWKDGASVKSTCCTITRTPVWLLYTLTPPVSRDRKFVGAYWLPA